MPIEKHTFDMDGDLHLLLARPAKQLQRSTENWSSAKISRFSRLGERNMSAIDLEGDTVVGNDEEEAFVTEIDSDTSLRDGMEDGLEENVEINMLVSSKHMMLVSPVFKAMLQRNNFREGCTLEFAGSVEVALHDDDPEAMLILLNVVHARNRSVPRKVSLEVLSKIAILVDKYQMVEAFEAFSDGWIEHLIPDLPKSYAEWNDGKPIFQWMAISWVFGQAKEFKTMTKLVERAGYEVMESVIDPNLPIPEIIIGRYFQYL